MAFFNGQGGSVTVGVNVLSVESWTGDFECEFLDTTSTGSSGWQNGIAGIKKGSGNVKAFVDDGNIPTGPLGITPGATATILVDIGNTGVHHSVPALITKIAFENPAKGSAVTYSFDFQSTGAITYAT